MKSSKKCAPKIARETARGGCRDCGKLIRWVFNPQPTPNFPHGFWVPTEPDSPERHRCMSPEETFVGGLGAKALARLLDGRNVVRMSVNKRDRGALERVCRKRVRRRRVVRLVDAHGRVSGLGFPARIENDRRAGRGRAGEGEKR